MGLESGLHKTPKKVEMPLPKLEGDLELNNYVAQAFFMLFAYQKKMAEEKEPKHIKIDLNELRCPTNDLIKKDAQTFWYGGTDIDNPSSPARAFSDYRDDPDHPEHAKETINPKKPEQLQDLYARVFLGETLEEQIEKKKQILH